MPARIRKNQQTQEPKYELVKKFPKPAFLSAELEPIWDELTGILAHHQVVKQTDKVAFTMLFDSLQKYADINKELKTDPYNRVLLKSRSEFWTEIFRMLREFGLTPRTRSASVPRVSVSKRKPGETRGRKPVNTKDVNRFFVPAKSTTTTKGIIKDGEEEEIYQE